MENSDHIASIEEGANAVKNEAVAQAVLNKLRQLEQNRESMNTRWVWELMQNALDASATEISVEYNQEGLVFHHNGSGFNNKEINKIIYSGSTKSEKSDKIGQFGTGFIVTHVLSPTVTISGKFGEKFFEFSLTRKIGYLKDFQKLLEDGYTNLKKSIINEIPEKHKGTKFLFKIESEESREAVNSGLQDLRNYVPLIGIFNEKLSKIDIKCQEHITFTFSKIKDLKENISEHEVVEKKSEIESLRKNYVVARSLKDCSNTSLETSERAGSRRRIDVAVPLEVRESRKSCLPMTDMPKLFLCFPLVGTENFSFPAIINSRDFEPREERDGVSLSKSKENIKNREIIETACDLLLGLIELAGESRWQQIYNLVTIPEITNKHLTDSEETKIWIKGDVLKKKLIEKFDSKKIIISESGNALTLRESKIPMAETKEDLENLFALIRSLKEFQNLLPAENEAFYWKEAVESWRNLDSLPEEGSIKKLVDINWLALYLNDLSDIKTLEEKLAEDQMPVEEWLYKLYKSMIRQNDSRIEESWRVPNQKR